MLAPEQIFSFLSGKEKRLHFFFRPTLATVDLQKGSKNEPTLAIRGVDTAENEHCEVCPLSVYRSPRLLVGLRLIRLELVEDALGGMNFRYFHSTHRY